MPELPPPGAPVSVVRPVRLPYEVDVAVKAIADARGVPISTVIREWVQAGLANAGLSADPVTETRRSLDVAQHTLDRLANRGVREAHNTFTPYGDPIR